MKTLKAFGFLIVPVVLLTGCGDSSLGKKFDLKLDPTAQTAALEIEMGDGLEVSMEGGFPLPEDLGQIKFVRATRSTNAKIAVEFDLKKVLAAQLSQMGTVTTLPSGAPLPVAMTPPLVSIKVLEDKNFKVSALIALMPELQVGAMVDIAAFNSKYVPGGISVCQNFRNSEKLAVAAICLYGPSATNSGGIFVGGNFGNVIPSNSNIISTSSAKSFASTAASTSALTFDPISMSSDISENVIYDPKSKLEGSKGVKAYNNVEKILRVRR